MVPTGLAGRAQQLTFVARLDGSETTAYDQTILAGGLFVKNSHWLAMQRMSANAVEAKPFDNHLVFEWGSWHLEAATYKGLHQTSTYTVLRQTRASSTALEEFSDYFLL